jgi:hypothetical protein
MPTIVVEATRSTQMSRRAVEIVIDRLLTDESLRRRFARDRIGTLAEFGSWGIPLTSDDIDLVLRADVRLWWLPSVWLVCADIVLHASS